MAKIYTIKLNSWQELSNYINSKFTHFNDFIFRGHADADWKLDSTLARSINQVYPDRTDIQHLINLHLHNFKLNIRGKSNTNFKDISDDDIWATGQHFGLYTPLLDFTKSPYVALFFALQGQSTSGKRCLWAFSESDLDLMKKQQLDPNLVVEKIVPLTNDNQRLVSQQGLFLKIPLNCSIEKLIEEHPKLHKGEAFFKIIFDDTITEEALLILQNMNINQSTLFPDLIGSAKQANFMFEIEPYIKASRRKIWEEFEKNSKTR